MQVPPLDVISGDDRGAGWSAGQIVMARDAGRGGGPAAHPRRVPVGWQGAGELGELVPAGGCVRGPLTCRQVPAPEGRVRGAGAAAVTSDRRCRGSCIGAQAAVAGGRLLTGDVRRYLTCFAVAGIIVPVLSPDGAAGEARPGRWPVIGGWRGQWPVARRPARPGPAGPPPGVIRAYQATRRNRRAATASVAR
jgi:hypothetical protein